MKGKKIKALIFDNLLGVYVNKQIKGLPKDICSQRFLQTLESLIQVGLLTLCGGSDPAPPSISGICKSIPYISFTNTVKVCNDNNYNYQMHPQISL